jgi:glucose/arabinose dehydrogenase
MSSRSLVILVAVGCGNNHNNDHVPPNGDALHDGVGDGTKDADPACATPGVLPAMHAAIVASGLTEPMYVTQPPGSTDLYIVEQGGKIVIARGGTVLATPFLDVSAQILKQASAEDGLLSMVFNPDYATTGRYFVYLTLPGPDRAVIREYHHTSGDTSDTTPIQDIVVQPESGYDIGGTIAFGPDHYLWVATGDGSDPPEAQDLTQRRGKMLRFDVDNAATPPPGGIGGAADPFVWAYGLRNPFRTSFDRKTGELYIGDAADQLFEEVDIEPPNMGGRDYGWPRREGAVCHDGTMTCGATGTLPAFARPHEPGYSVLIGGSVYRGAALPCLRGNYVYGVFGTTGHILTWSWTGATTTADVDITNTLDVDPSNNIVAITEDQAGELYLVMHGAGLVYKIVPN